ncbi:MAG: lipopolysaccharide biosynthesis protein [Proteobacteria bacterium]|nr:lipopolysaccharide biosynthesis protein [Pseudomonadota bacterium]
MGGALSPTIADRPRGLSLRGLMAGTAAMSTATMVRLVVQFFAVPVLARALSPFDYGLVGMAMPLVVFAMMIADAGIGMSLVRSAESERSVWATCFWLSSGLGAVLAVGMCAAAPIAARLLHAPDLTLIVMAMALYVFAQSILIIPQTMLQKQHRFPTLAAIDMVAIAASIAAAVAIAFHGGGPWALVGQQLVYAGLRVAATLAASPFRPMLAFDLNSAADHLRFGRDILAVNTIRFFTRSLDNLVIGHRLGAAAVGLYAMTWQFVTLPVMLVSGPLQYVLYAQLGATSGDPRTTGRLFLILIRALATLVFPVIAIGAVAHAAVFGTLLSSKWDAAGFLYLLMAPASAIQTLTTLIGAIVLSLGRTDIQRRMTTEFGLLWLTALLASVWFGLVGVGFAYSVTVMVYAPRQIGLVLPLIDCTKAALLRRLLTPSASAAAAALAYVALDRGLSSGDGVDGGPSRLALAAGLAALAMLAGGLAQRHALANEIGRWRRGGGQPTATRNRPDVPLRPGASAETAG